MINIFNLFLFLLAIWSLLMVLASKVSLLYIIFGIVFSITISFISFKMKLIDKDSELLYLSFGFYRHFFGIFIGNFFSSLKMILVLALFPNRVKPTLCKIVLNKKYIFNPALLITTINMNTGLLCIGTQDKDNEFLVHAIDEKYFDRFDLQKVCDSLNEVNDDNLV